MNGGGRWVVLRLRTPLVLNPPLLPPLTPPPLHTPPLPPPQIVILGTGKKALESQVKNLEKQFPGLAAGVVKFSNPMAHNITAGALRGGGHVGARRA